MAFAGVEDSAAVWNGAGLVLTHGRRYTHILLPVPKVDSCGNVFQQKPPRASVEQQFACGAAASATEQDRKSTRLNSSHRCISYAVFCLKKKNKQGDPYPPHQHQIAPATNNV